MATQPISNLVTTWNAAGTTFNAIKMNVTDTASAAASLLMDLQVGGSRKFSVDKTGNVTAGNSIYSGNGAGIGLGNGAPGWWSSGVGLRVTATDILGWVPSTNATATADLVLARDTANTLAQRNSTNAQAFRVYNTYTDASNYERLGARWSSNTILIGVETAGTGVNRSMSIDAFNVNILTQGSGRWKWDQNGHFITNADNTYDIGASGANRPRHTYIAGNYYGATGSYHYFWGTARTVMTSTADGLLLLQNSAGTSFDRLQFGGTTSSFPSLKRNGTVLQLRLADDSSSADLTAAQITANASTAMPAGGAVTAGVKMSTTANFGVFFGSGAPTLSAAKGSLYLRSDGTTTNDRMYVNTDGATTWTAVTTAA